MPDDGDLVAKLCQHLLLGQVAPGQLQVAVAQLLLHLQDKAASAQEVQESRAGELAVLQADLEAI